MRVTVAIDSFKGSLSTFESGKAVSEAVKEVFPAADVEVRPLADGGEGTVEAISYASGGNIITVKVHDPLGRETEACYGYSENNKTAVIEMAAASGITLVSEKERNPLNTSSYGTGELIRDAISRSARRFIIGIGGSATNDGGVGMLEALGFEFLDADGKAIHRSGKGLADLASISCKNAIPELSECEFLVACDVKNPLCGVNGCSAVYGPQKGADEKIIKDMDAWLENYARLTKEIFPSSDACHPGVGAAGGLGFAFLSYLDAKLTSGIDLIIEETKLEEYIKNADIVITGEGKLDSQSCMGKAPIGVARVAKKHGKTVIAFSGCIGDGAESCNENGIDAFFPILRNVVTLDDALNAKNAYANLKACAKQVFNLIKTLQ